MNLILSCNDRWTNRSTKTDQGKLKGLQYILNNHEKQIRPVLFTKKAINAELIYLKNSFNKHMH